LKSDLANNAWFVAFGPRENPEIAVVALFENGQESYNAVPIVRDILKAYFDKKARPQTITWVPRQLLHPFESLDKSRKTDSLRVPFALVATAPEMVQ
jgi:hypothetical protein